MLGRSASERAMITGADGVTDDDDQQLDQRACR